jgi:hypothetical protein
MGVGPSPLRVAFGRGEVVLLAAPFRRLVLVLRSRLAPIVLRFLRERFDQKFPSLMFETGFPHGFALFHMSNSNFSNKKKLFPVMARNKNKRSRQSGAAVCEVMTLSFSRKKRIYFSEKLAT